MEVVRRGILFVDSTGVVVLCETMKMSKPPRPGRAQIVLLDLDYTAVPLRTQAGYQWSWSDTVEVRGVKEDDHLRAIAPAVPVQAR